MEKYFFLLLGFYVYHLVVMWYVLKYINLLRKCLFCNHNINCSGTCVLCQNCIAAHFK